MIMIERDFLVTITDDAGNVMIFSATNCKIEKSLPTRLGLREEVVEQLDCEKFEIKGVT